ncbi:MAG: small basic family protein [Candidatus Gracilibacteria bacterium]|nr:small basic family protein [Candidatus Gracilibacteria bacterium]
MRWITLGFLAGVLLAIIFQVQIPVFLTRYTAVAIMGILDAIFGATRAKLVDNKYDPIIFATGLIFNILLAVAITYLGDRLGLDLYLAASIVFTFRIFANVGVSRRAILEKFLKKKGLIES